MANMSSAVRGLIPKSSGGRMALGGMGALGVAAGVRGFKNNQRRSQLNKEMNAFDRLPLAQRKQMTLDSAYSISPEHGDYMNRRIQMDNFPTL